MEFNYVIDWLKEKACARKAGLGTPLPWTGLDHRIASDSTIYMAFYTIAEELKRSEVDAEKISQFILQLYLPRKWLI